MACLNLMEMFKGSKVESEPKRGPGRPKKARFDLEPSMVSIEPSEAAGSREMAVESSEAVGSHEMAVEPAESAGVTAGGRWAVGYCSSSP